MDTSTIIGAVVAAVAASLCYAVGAALEQREAHAAATDRVVHPGLLWQVLRRPVWLAGFGAMVAGEVLHVLALAWAPLAVVQPIGVTTVLFALPLGAVLARRRPRLPELAAAGAIVAGLAALLAGMHVSNAAPVLTDRGLAVLAPIVAGGLGVLVLLAMRASGAVRTLLLGCAAGAAFGTTAALVRLVTMRVEAHGLTGLVGWVSPMIAVTAATGLLLEQGAYKSGHLGVAVAGYTVVDPIVSVTVGALVLHQSARLGNPVLTVAEAIVVAVGVTVLARRTTAPPTASTPPADVPAGPSGGGRPRRGSSAAGPRTLVRPVRDSPQCASRNARTVSTVSASSGRLSSR